MIVKGTIFDFFDKKVNLEKYANSISLYLNSDKGNIDNIKNLNIILADSVRDCANLQDFDIEIPFSVELKDLWTGLPLLKNHIDIIIKKSKSEILLQTIISNDLNYDINNFILESLKLSLEHGDFKHILFFCNRSIFNTYLTNYGLQKRFQISELSYDMNFEINNIQNNIDYFELHLINGPFEIAPSFVLLHFQVV